MPFFRIEGSARRQLASIALRPRGGVAPPTGYQRLFDVAIEHGYEAGSECCDFDVYPNGRTTALMARLGLVFLPSASGFSVLYNADRGGDLASYLRNTVVRHPASEGAEPGERWTYLSFFVAPRTPRVFNVTDMPLRLHPLVQNYYFANGGVGPARAHREPGRNKPEEILLGQSQSGISDADLLPVRPARFDVIIPKKGRAVVMNAAGMRRQTIDRADFEKKRDLLEHPEGSGLSAAALETLRKSLQACFFSTPEEDETYGGHVDLSRYDEGLYRLEVTGEAGEIVKGSSYDFIYAISTPAPLCFMHILLCQPVTAPDGPVETPDSGAAPVKLYPVSPGDAPGKEAYVFRRYILRFAARRTTWRYHVVPRRGLDFRALKIQSVPGSGAEHVFAAKDGAALRRLPNGAEGYTFSSKETLPLLRRSEVRLQLVGVRADVGRERVLLEPLPLPRADQIPIDGGDGGAVSEIYVHV